LNRFFLGIVFGVAASALFAVSGFDWSAIAPPAAAATSQEGARRAASECVRGGPLSVHHPVPHPALVAAGQLFISLYVLIAQHKPREEPAA
jgi:hypothetical protein